MNIKLRKDSLLPACNMQQLEFGKHTSDHMFIADYVDGEWTSGDIVPYGDLLLDPATLALHYGQTIFEGMKAFRMEDGNISIFRMERHQQRLLRSAERMCMQAPPAALFAEALKTLLEIDHEWVPAFPGSLYIRPFIIATEPKLGIKISSSYKFIIITGPVPELFSNPIRLKVEDKFVRAATGGTGAVKCGGNYGAAFYPTAIARSEGYDQVLWTDSSHQYLEESGMMNIMLVMNGKIVTPALSDSILDGVTRNSLLTLASAAGIPVEERTISVKELEGGLNSGLISEAFGVGTAAVISPVGVIGVTGRDYSLPDPADDSIQEKLKRQLKNIRAGVTPDEFSWNTVVQVPHGNYCLI
jgi:branched-chain amino acid aminotransferase